MSVARNHHDVVGQILSQMQQPKGSKLVPLSQSCSNDSLAKYLRTDPVTLPLKVQSSLPRKKGYEVFNELVKLRQIELLEIRKMKEDLEDQKKKVDEARFIENCKKACSVRDKRSLRR